MGVSQWLYVFTDGRMDACRKGHVLFELEDVWLARLYFLLFVETESERGTRASTLESKGAVTIIIQESTLYFEACRHIGKHTL